MSSSNVRNIESLEAFHAGLIGLSGDWDKTLQEVRMMVKRAETHFAQEMPAYWRRQTRLAERALTEAKDNLAQLQAAVRAADRPPATEAAKRVKLAERRLHECQSKQRLAKSWSIEMSRQCDDLLGPLADVVEHCEIMLPAAALELRGLIDQLRLYAEQEKGQNRSTGNPGAGTP